MGTYRMLYDFAAKVGALEGYVYPKEKIDPQYLPAWVDHVVEGYEALPSETRAEFQDLCDATLGRAIASLLPLLGAKHDVIRKLRSITKGTLPSSPDDFPNRQR
ncbi:MAG TPA: hypothetical protein VKF36_20665 [Syntrophorhabdales bacterium]|nr:hypothetical protein [Syntrophorhabdales bacterium]